MNNNINIKQIFNNYQSIEKEFVIRGWIRQIRGNKKILFINLNDGSCFQTMQVVVKNNIEEIGKARIGAAIEVLGRIVLVSKKEQPFEMIATKITILKNIDEDYPIQKKEISMEYLREVPHLRHHTNLFKAIMRIRSTLALEIHNFFNHESFLYMNSPIITSNDGEGAGEAFGVVAEDDNNFFNTKATLGVTGQLHAESYANGFGKVYTFGPTFRAEKSHTQKHAAEFWMIEPEVAFYDIQQIIKLADKMLKTIIKKTLKINYEEIKYLETKLNKNLFSKLNKLIENEIAIISYKDVIIELEKVKDKFEFNDIHFGMDLATEHERYICEKIFQSPVAVINYPKEIKAFYMYQNTDNKTVAAFDLLVPGIGELIGGSQRETDISKLTQRIKELGIDVNDLKWYLDLRRFGHYKSSGFGLGFERLVMYVTGIDNIRDVIPYPRTHKKMLM